MEHNPRLPNAIGTENGISIYPTRSANVSRVSHNVNVHIILINMCDFPLGSHCTAPLPIPPSTSNLMIVGWDGNGVALGEVMKGPIEIFTAYIALFSFFFFIA